MNFVARQLTRHGVKTLLLLLTLCAPAVDAYPFIVYTGEVPDYMISTGPTLEQSTGLITEIDAAAFKQAGLEVRLAPEMPWARAQALAVKQPGAVLPELCRTVERESHWRWLVMVFNENIYALTLKDHTAWYSLEDMQAQHARIGTRRGSGTASLLQGMGIKANEAIDTDTSFAQLASGTIDVLLIQKFALHPAIDSLQHGPHQALLAPLITQLRATLLPDGIEEWGVTSRSTPQAEAQKLTDALRAFMATAQFQTILNKYEARVPALESAGK